MFTIKLAIEIFDNLFQIPLIILVEYFATTIFSHRYQPKIVGLFEALLRRDDITKEDLDAISAMIAQKNV